MTKNKRLKYAEIILLVMIWAVLLAAPLLFREEMEFSWTEMRRPLQSIIPLFIIFLINRFVLVPYLLFKKKNVQYFVSAGIMIALITIGLYFIERGNVNEAIRPGPAGHVRQSPPPPGRIAPGTPPPPSPEPGGPIPPFANFLILAVLLVGFDTGLKISFKLAESERIKDKLEKDNVESQLAFLRNQVSPHFFMNTLNNIHSLIDFDTEEAKESIISLSKLMRHLLYDSENETISIQKEMEFISNYVDLMKLRFSDKVKISLKIPDQLPDKSIPPLLFTSFLENAFKHGISYQNSSFIDITLRYASNVLTFEILNSNAPINKEEDKFGIGIENSRKRLDLLYGNRYSLNIKDENDEFYVNLSIPV